MTLRVFYGGTFDPVHNGHVAIACAVRDRLDAEVALLPAADPPHKPNTHAHARHRAAMLQLAIDGLSHLRVDCREFRRSGPSFTIETLRELRDELGPIQPIAWLIGSDALIELDTWKDWRRLFDHAHIIAVERPGSRVDADWLEVRAPEVHAEISPRSREPASLHDTPAGGYAGFVLPQQRLESSTELRRRLGAGEPWQDLLPAAVVDYILRHGLYRNRTVASPPL